MDDTSVVVGEIIEWTEAHTQIWSEANRHKLVPRQADSVADSYRLAGEKKSALEGRHLLWWPAVLTLAKRLREYF